MRVVDKLLLLGGLLLTALAPRSAHAQADAPKPAAAPVVAGTLTLRALVPFEGYARRTKGMSIAGGAWIELGQLALAPEFSLAFDVEDPRYGYFHLTPLELGAYWVLPLGAQHALYTGPGLGIHFWFERLDTQRSVGSFVRAQTVDTIHDDVFGLGVFARLGVIFFRHAPVSLAPSIDYAVTFAEFLDAARAQAVRVNIALLLGGKR